MSGTDMTTVDPGVSDADLFAGATAPEPDEKTVEAEAKEQDTGEQPRNPDGTFASKEAEQPAAEEPKAETPTDDPDKGGQIPSWRLREETEARRRIETDLAAERTERARERAEFAVLQQQVAELRKPAETKPEDKPDPLLDPQGFAEYLERKFEDKLLNDRRELSLRSAHRTHKEAFTEAYAEGQKAMASGDRALAARMQASPDPGETLISWHREQKTMREVGNDPAAYKQRLLDEALKDPAYLAKAIAAANASAGSQNNGARPAVRLPPSLSGAARADAHETNPSDLDASDEGLFRHATAGMR